MPNTVKTDARCAMLGPLSRTQFCTSICATGITRQRTTDNPNPISAHDAAFDNSLRLTPITTHPRTQTIRIGNCVANRESKAVSCALSFIGFIPIACNGRRILCKLIQRPPLALRNFGFFGSEPRSKTPKLIYVNHVYQRTRRGAKDPSREPQATRVALGWECPLKERLPWFANGAENRLTILDRLSSILAPPTV